MSRLSDEATWHPTNACHALEAPAGLSQDRRWSILGDNLSGRPRSCEGGRRGLHSVDDRDFSNDAMSGAHAHR
ncbi:MAG: hypothetical protein ACLQCU_10225 [Acidimicrobiales bacterium]